MKNYKNLPHLINVLLKAKFCTNIQNNKIKFNVPKYTKQFKP